MNRPYYALAALLAVLSSAVVSVSPARCQSSTATSFAPHRYLCMGTGAKFGSYQFVHYDLGKDAEHAADQDDQWKAYANSCGYDAGRAERYEAEYFLDDAGQDLVGNHEVWPTDERIEEQYHRIPYAQPNRCGGDEIYCPYFGGRASDFAYDEPVDDDQADWDCGWWREDEYVASDRECEQVQEQWLAEQEAIELAQQMNGFEDESAFFADDAWKTQKLATPNWLEGYLGENEPSIEEQYAQAEIEAAREAGAEVAMGPATTAANPKRADYAEEYQSLYDLDALVIPADEDDQEWDVKLEDGDRPSVIRPLRRFANELLNAFFGDATDFEEDAAELLESADAALETWQDISTTLIALAENIEAEKVVRDFVESEDRYASRGTVLLPEEAAESRQMLESTADCLRFLGNLLLRSADNLEAQAEQILSAQVEGTIAR